MLIFIVAYTRNVTFYSYFLQILKSRTSGIICICQHILHADIMTGQVRGCLVENKWQALTVPYIGIQTQCSAYDMGCRIHAYLSLVAQA